VHSRLAIDYGAATVRAVLIAPGGTTMLTLDGAGEMPTAAHISDSGVVIGAAAWRQAATDPDGLVVSPLRAGTGQVTAGGVQVDVVDLVAAALRQVAAEAQRVAGEPVDDVRLVVPAGWGPRRRTWMRHAARAAGLAVSRLVEAPVAAIARLDSRTAAEGLPADDGPALVIDVGAGCEVTVVQRDPAGAEVVSTLADPDAGGDRLDAALVTTLTATDLHDMPAGQRWAMLTNIRAARHALSEQVAVTMPMPGRPPMVINTTQVAEVSRPVFERAGELAAQALHNADLTLDRVTGVHLIGAATVTPGAGDMIAAKLGTVPVPVEPVHAAAVLGAADADTTEAIAVEEPLPLPPVRRLITLALPGVASLALFASYIFFSGDYRLGYNNTIVPMANWGIPAVAATLAMICLLQAAALFAALLDHNTPTTSVGQPTGRISGGITIALLGGLATATMYAITAGLYFNQAIPRLAQGIVLTVLPIAVLAAAVAVLAWRRGVTPVGGWDGFLTFPASPMIIAVAGIVAVNLWYTVAWPWWFAGWANGIGLAGGLLIGVAAACTLVRHPGARLALTVPIGFFTVIISRTGPAPLAVIWALAVACWWGVHAWALLRTPPVRR
jgi:hypothetical protein